MLTLRFGLGPAGCGAKRDQILADVDYNEADVYQTKALMTSSPDITSSSPQGDDELAHLVGDASIIPPAGEGLRTNDE